MNGAWRCGIRQLVHIAQLLCVVVFVAALVPGCSSSEVPVPTGQGKVHLSIAVDAQMQASEGGQVSAANPIAINKLSMSMSSSDEAYSHTWNSVADFDDSQTFPTGTYKVTVFYNAKNDGTPSYYASTDVVVKADETTEVALTAKIADACVGLSVGSHNASVVPTGMWVRDGKDSMHQLQIDGRKYIADGTVAMYPVVSDATGSRTLVLDMSAVARLYAATYSEYTIDGDDNTLEINGPGVSGNVSIGQDFWTASAPVVQSNDIAAGSTLTVSEGVPLDAPVVITATSDRRMAHLSLSMNSSVRNGTTDMLATTPDVMLSEMYKHGMTVDVSADGRTITMDFTRLIEQAPTLNAVYTQIAIMATDDRGVCSEPFLFDVDSKTVKLSLASATPAVVGIDRTTVTLNTSTTDVEEGDFSVRVSTSEGGTECPIKGWVVDETVGTISFDINLPEGLKPVDLTVYYLGTPRVRTTVARATPQCTMDIDAYATTMYITFDSEQGDAVASALAKNATFYASGNKLSVWERYPENKAVVVSGLTPGTSYNVSACVIDNTPAALCSITTEAAEDLPQGTFEDVKTIYEAKNMPCGGRYSTKDVPVASRQNFSDIKVIWPEKYWAGVNAKTFSDACALPNTWYKMPSGNIVETLANDTRVICLTSVGWDLNGSDIPDYIQSPGQYIPYNNNIPEVAHRSAGKLFLGSYTFDPKTLKEVYNEGIPFHSRPSALNGFYKYLPDATSNDAGLIRLSVYGVTSEGVELIIGGGEAKMHIAADMTAFSIPIHYSISGVKATRLCLMASSSSNIGDIEYEDKNVPVTAYPQKGAYIGSSLWLNALHLSY